MGMVLRSSASKSHGIRPAYNLVPIRSDPARRPTPRRLRRVTDQWLQVGQSSMIARITVLQQGGHRRPVITRGSKHLRFRYTSTKTQTTQLGEGFGERHLARYNEVATRVRDYESHPFEFEIARNGHVQRYRVDSVRLLDDGTIELIEVKRTPADLSDGEYRELLAAIAEIARICGWVFRILNLEDVMGPPAENPRHLTHRVRNVDALFGRRSMSLSPSEQRISSRLLGRCEPIAWADLRDRLAPGDPLQGDAVIERLLARGSLSTDLDVRWSPATILIPTPPFVGQSGIRL